MHSDGAGVRDGPSRSSARRVRRHARNVALGATGLAFVVYVVVGLVADLVVVGHLQAAVDGRLRGQLATLRDRPAAAAAGRALRDDAGGTGAPAGTRPDEGVLDDAPVLAWWVPARGGRPVPLDTDGLALPPGDVQTGGPTVATLAGRSFRLLSAPAAGGRYVVGTSIQQLGSVRVTLVTAEGGLLPFVLVTFFLVAYAIGRRAAAPVERARAQQLEFTADASHELRTPLSVIEAEVGLALSAPRDAPALQVTLERIGGESRRLRRIVDDLLWLARADGLPLGPPGVGPVELGAVADEAVARFSALAAHHELALCLELDGEVPAVVDAPADWLDRLLSVLLDNACRYVAPGGAITVSVQVDAGRCVLRVDDSGEGIPDELVPKVVRRFGRASDEPGGAGLGLAIADTVVRTTGGRWEIGRSPAGGARVAASWPQAKSQPAPNRHRARHHVKGRLQS